MLGQGQAWSLSRPITSSGTTKRITFVKWRRWGCEWGAGFPRLRPEEEGSERSGWSGWMFWVQLRLRALLQLPPRLLHLSGPFSGSLRRTRIAFCASPRVCAPRCSWLWARSGAEWPWGCGDMLAQERWVKRLAVFCRDLRARTEEARRDDVCEGVGALWPWSDVMLRFLRVSVWNADAITQRGLLTCLRILIGNGLWVQRNRIL